LDEYHKHLITKPSTRYNQRGYEMLLDKYNLKVKLARLQELEQIHGEINETIEEKVKKKF
jgi:hypothetical protein